VLILSAAAKGEAIHGSSLEAVFSSAEATLEDRAEYLRLALDNDDGLTFLRMYNTLSVDDRRASTAVAIQRMRLSLLLKRNEEARDLYAALPEEVRHGDVLVAGLTARVRSSRLATEMTLVQQALADVITSGDLNDEQTWEVYRLIGEIPPARRRWQWLPGLREWLATRRDATVDDRLIAATIDLVEADASERAALRMATVEALQEHDGAAVGEWLLSLGHPSEVLAMEAMAPEVAVQAVESFEVRLKALVAVERWQEASEWLDLQPAGSHPVMIALSRANVSSRLGDEATVRQHLAQAIDEAEGFADQDFFFLVAGEARRLGEEEVETRAALRGVRARRGMLPPKEWFGPLQMRLWDADRIVEFRLVNHALLLRDPNDSVMSNNELYLSLVIDADPDLDRIIAESRELVAKRPFSLGLRTTLALALTRRGGDEALRDARTALASPALDWSSAGDADRVILAMVQWEQGEASEAAETLAAVDAAKLRTVERERLWQPLVNAMAEERS
jgi:hypothetical protein